MANNQKWPPVEPLLIERLEAWVELAVPVVLGQNQTAQDCLIAMAERRGIQKLLVKMTEIARIQREG